MQTAVLPVFLLIASLVALAVLLILAGRVVSPRRPGRVKLMPYESGMDPVHDTRRRFLVRFHLVAIAFLIFDVELLFLYPWAVAFQPHLAEAQPPAATAPAATGSEVVERWPADRTVSRPPYLFVGGMIFILLLGLGFVYDWRKGVFQWW
jgi:NADH-quinone oxidoreductase subunit A